MFSGKLREVKRREVEVEKKRKEEEEKSEEEATPAKKLKKVGGVVSSPGIGFMRMDAEETNDEKKDDENEDENIKTVEIKPKKKPAAQYLAGEVIPKVENRSATANLNSVKFLTAKKKFAAIQPECGVEQDFIIMLKNNLQKDTIRNASPTAAKYMVFGRGSIKDQLLETGIKFDSSSMYMLANDYNYEEEKIEEEVKEDVMEGVAEEVAENVVEKVAEEGAVEKVVKETVVQKVVKEKEGKISIYNMKAVAKKIFTPGAFEDDSEDE